jgi:hypothetical protein
MQELASPLLRPMASQCPLLWSPQRQDRQISVCFFQTPCFVVKRAAWSTRVTSGSATNKLTTVSPPEETYKFCQPCLLQMTPISRPASETSRESSQCRGCQQRSTRNSQKYRLLHKHRLAHFDVASSAATGASGANKNGERINLPTNGTTRKHSKSRQSCNG